MSQTEATRQSDYIRPPRAALMASLAANTTATSIDLSLIGYTTTNMGVSDQEPPAQGGITLQGLIGKYITVYADGQDVGIICGATQASVTSANAPVLATNGTNAAGVCYRIPNGQERSYKITVNDRWLGYVAAAGTAQLRIFQSSP